MVLWALAHKSLSGWVDWRISVTGVWHGMAGRENLILQGDWSLRTTHRESPCCMTFLSWPWIMLSEVTAMDWRWVGTLYTALTTRAPEVLIRFLNRRAFSGMNCVSRWNISKPLIDCTSKSCSPNTRISSCLGDGDGFFCLGTQPSQFIHELNNWIYP